MAHRSNELYESTLVVEGVLGEKACTLQLRGQGSYDERYVLPTSSEALPSDPQLWQ